MSASGLTVAPAAALVAVYASLLVCSLTLAVLVPPLRRVRVFVSVYLSVRLFSLSVWLALALGASLSAPLINASFSLFYSGFFLLVTASFPLFYLFYPLVEAACGEPAAPLVRLARGARLASYAGVILLVASGTQLLQASIGNTSVAWAGPVGIVGASLLILVTAVALPFTLTRGSVAVSRARESSLDAGRRAALGRLLAAAALLTFVCVCATVRGAFCVVQAAGDPTVTQATLYGLVIGPELPAALALLAPIGGLFPPAPPPAVAVAAVPAKLLPPAR